MLNFNVDTQLKDRLNGFRADQFKELYLNENVSYVRKILPLVALGDFLLRLATRIALVAENLFKGFCNLVTGEFCKGIEQFFKGAGCNIVMLLPDTLIGIVRIFEVIHIKGDDSNVKRKVSARWEDLDVKGWHDQATKAVRATQQTVQEQDAEALEKIKAAQEALILKGESGEYSANEYYALANMYERGSISIRTPDPAKYWEYMVKAADKGHSDAKVRVNFKKQEDERALAREQAQAAAQAAAEARAKAAAETKAANEVAEYKRLTQIAENPNCDIRVLERLGTMTAKGIGTEKNLDLAQAFLQRALEQRQEIERLRVGAEKEKQRLETECFNILMSRYESGQATPAEIYQISEWYSQGNGVNRDEKKATEFKIKAIELLYVPAMYNCESHIIEEKLARHVVSTFSPVNTVDEQAVRPFVEVVAKKQNNPVAMFYIGYFYAKEGSWENAKIWFHKLSKVPEYKYSERGSVFTLAVVEHQKRIAGTIPHYHTEYPKLKELFTSLDRRILEFGAQETERLIPTYEKVRESLNKTWG